MQKQKVMDTPDAQRRQKLKKMVAPDAQRDRIQR